MSQLAQALLVGRSAHVSPDNLQHLSIPLLAAPAQAATPLHADSPAHQLAAIAAILCVSWSLSF